MRLENSQRIGATLSQAQCSAVLAQRIGTRAEPDLYYLPAPRRARHWDELLWRDRNPVGKCARCGGALYGAGPIAHARGTAQHVGCAYLTRASR